MTDSLLAGEQLMLLGMSVVFIFLAMLVLAVNVMSKLVRRFYPETETTTPTNSIAVKSSGADAGVVAAITAAVHSHRNKHK